MLCGGSAGDFPGSWLALVRFVIFVETVHKLGEISVERCLVAMPFIFHSERSDI